MSTRIPAFLAFSLLLMGLTACQSGPSFHRMSEAELAAYNATVEGSEQIYCVDEVRAGSHIRRRHCASVAEIAGALQNQANALDAINYGPPNRRVATPGYNRPRL